VEAQTVADLLEEYKNKGHNIDVENIDPIQNPGKVDALINSVVEKYNTDINRYKEFITSLRAKTDEIKSLSDKEVDKLKGLVPQFEKIANEQGAHAEEVAQTLNLVGISVSALPRQIKENDQAVQRMLTQKLPDYRGITDSVQMTMSVLSATLSKITEDFTKFKDEQDPSPEISKYMETLCRSKKAPGTGRRVGKGPRTWGRPSSTSTTPCAMPCCRTIHHCRRGRRLAHPFFRQGLETQPGRGSSGASRIGRATPSAICGEQMITTAILALQMKQNPKFASCAPAVRRWPPAESRD